MPPFPVVSPPGRDDPAPERFIPGLYSVTLVAFFGSVGLLWRIDGSPFGKALRAIRDNETRAEFVGIPVRRYRWRAFIISAAFTGLAGGLYGQLDRQVTPEQLHWVWSAKLVLATVLGGMRQFPGPVVAAFAFVTLQDFALRFLRSKHSQGYGDHTQIQYGHHYPSPEEKARPPTNRLDCIVTNV